MNVRPKGAPALEAVLAPDGCALPETEAVLKVLGEWGAFEAARAAGDDEARDKVLARAWRQIWETPPELVRGLEILAGATVGLDVCSEARTAKAPRFFGPGSEIATNAWSVGIWSHYAVRGIMYANPPYASIAPWVDELVFETEAYGSQSWLLVPPRTDQGWCADLLDHDLVHMTAFRGRPKFLAPPGLKASQANGPVVLFTIGWEDRILPPTLRWQEVLRLGSRQGHAA